MIRLLSRLRRQPPVPVPAPRPRIEPRAPMPPGRQPMKVSPSALASRLAEPAEQPRKVNPYRLPRYVKGVLPQSRTELAQDENVQQIVANAWDFGDAVHGLWSEGIGFMGYPYLAELSQRAEYRRASEVIAEEMTRKWIEVKATGEQDKSDKIKVLNDRLEQFNVRQVFRQSLEHDGFFGIGMMFLDFGDGGADELQTKLALIPEKIGHHRLRGIRPIDPTWSAPNRYDSRDPTSPAYYKPQTWFVMGREIHSTRLLTVISRPLPDILKPAYNFGGLSLSQMMKPYVDNWLRTRQSVADLINSFTVFNLATNLEGLLAGAGGEQEAARLDLFTKMRNNRGLLVTDKNTEEFQNISAPLGTLDHLQAQAQEQICSVIAVPLVKYLGVTPSGLNASADGEIRVFYDGIKARQEKVCSDPVRTILQILQLDEWGEVDPEIGFEWVPLWELDEAAAAGVRKTEADTDAVLVEVGAIDADEVRQRVAAEPESPYAGLDLSKPAPGPQQPPEGEGEGAPGDPEDPTGGEGEDQGSLGSAILEALRDGGVGDATGHAVLEALRLRRGDKLGETVVAALARKGGAGERGAVVPFGADAAAWQEADHPRDESGQFTAGGGASISSGFEGISGGSGGSGWKASLPKPPSYVKGFGEKIGAAVTAHQGDPGELIAQVKSIAQAAAHNPNNITYANKVLKHLAAASGQMVGKLSAQKPATGGAAGAVGQPPAPSPTPASPAATAPAQGLPQPPGGAAYAGNFYALATGAAPPLEKAAKIGNYLAHMQAEGHIAEGSPAAMYAAQLMAALGQQHGTGPVEVKGPDPHPDSTPQQEIHKLATDPSTTPQEKIAAIKADPTVQGYPNGYTAKFAAEWVKAISEAHGIKPEQAAPKPKKAAAPKAIPNVHGAAAQPASNIVSAPPTARATHARTVESKARQPNGTHLEESREVAPSLKPEFWATVDNETKQICDQYGGSYYHTINGAMRDENSWDATTQSQIDKMDALFFHDDAMTTEDVIIRRGEGMEHGMAEAVAKWRVELAKGKSCLYSRVGYTSASMANQPAFSSKPLWWHFVAPKGSRMVGLAGRVGHGENEVLLNHGQQTEIYEIWDAGGKTHIKAILR